MLYIAVCDDCPSQMDVLLALLDAYGSDRPDMEIRYKSFSSGNELVASLDSGDVFDLFLLDILMPGQNGIELARKIRERDSGVPLVFLTSSADYALDAFDVSAIQYLVKPVSNERLFLVLDRIAATAKPEEIRYFMLSAAGRIVRVPFASIVCAELFGRVMKVHQADGNVLMSKTIRTPFCREIAPLLSDSRFLCPHKSYVINMAWVEELTGKAFIMKHGIYVPVPRYKHAEAKAKYFAWLSENGICRVGGKRK